MSNYSGNENAKICKKGCDSKVLVVISVHFSPYVPFVHY